MMTKNAVVALLGSALLFACAEGAPSSDEAPEDRLEVSDTEGRRVVKEYDESGAVGTEIEVDDREIVVTRDGQVVARASVEAEVDRPITEGATNVRPQSAGECNWILSQVASACRPGGSAYRCRIASYVWIANC